MLRVNQKISSLKKLTRRKLLDPSNKLGGARDGAGAKKGTRQYDRAEILKTLEECGCDPIHGMAMIAMGDVVKLGYMTVEELNASAVIERNPDTGKTYVVRPSGMEMAMTLVPPMLRAKMYAELTQYITPRLASTTLQNPDGSAVGGIVAQFYLPSNGREKT